MPDAIASSKWPTLGSSSDENTYKDTATSTYATYFYQWMKVSNDGDKACEQKIYSGTTTKQDNTTTGDAMDDDKCIERDQQVCQLNFALSTVGPSFTETVTSIWDKATHEESSNCQNETQSWEAAVLRSFEWLCQGVHAINGIKLSFPSQRLVQHALEHVLLRDAPASQAMVVGKGSEANSTPAFSLPPSLMPLRYNRQGAGIFRPALVLLLFHRQAEVRVRAREALLTCVNHAFTSAPDSLISDTSFKPEGKMSLELESSGVPMSAVTLGVSRDDRPQFCANRDNSGIGSGKTDIPTPLSHASQKPFDSTCVEKALLEHRFQTLWRLSLELLCVFKHLTQVRFMLLQGNPHVSPLLPPQLSPHSSEITRTMSEGVYHLFVILTVLDQRITKIANGRSAFLQRSTGNPPSKLPHPVAVLLLGGSMSLEWLFGAHEDLVKGIPSSFTSFLLQCITGYDSKAKEEEISRLVRFRAMRDIVEGLNNGLRHDQTLQPNSLATQVKKALGKVIIHAILECARVSRASSLHSVPLSASREELDWRAKQLKSCWWLAGALDSPTSFNSRTVDEPGARFGGGATPETATTPPQRTCLYWLLEPLLKNAHIQWRLDEVVLEARTPPAANSSITANKDKPTQPTMLECTVHSYYLLFYTLIKAMPDVVASTFFHSLLEKYEQVVNALAVGGVLRHGSPNAIYLFEFLFHADLLSFSDAGRIWLWNEQAANSSPAFKRVLGDAWTNSAKVTKKQQPLLCLQRAWTNYPAVLKQLLKDDHLNRFSHVMVQLIGVLHVFVNISASISQYSQWLLLLPEDSNWPQPLGAVLKNFLTQLLEFFEMHARGIKEKWAAADPSAALSRLLTSGLDIPWLVSRLKYAQSSQLQHLADLLNSVFLDNLGPTARLTFTSDAAQWVWQDVLLHQEPLMGFAHGDSWLQLHIPRVDNLARQQGKQWLRVFTACNWCSMRTENRDCSASSSPTLSWSCTVASVWWMVSLLADVVTLDTEERVVFLKQVVTELPQPPFLCLSQDADKLYEIVKHLFLCLLEKHLSYPRVALPGALLHVASMLPSGKAEADVRLSNAAKRPMVALLDRYLLKEGRQTLDRYSPEWLTRIIQSATCAINASLVEEGKSFELLEWQEKQLTIVDEEKKVQASNDVKMRQLSETMRVQEINTARGLALSKTQNTNSNIQSIVSSRKRSRKPPWMEDESGSDSSSVISLEGPTVLPRSLPMGESRSLLVAFRPAVEHADAFKSRTSSRSAVGPVQSAHQRHLQAINDHKVQKLRFSEYENEIVKAMQGVVGRTTILNREPRVDDIIGNAAHCLAENVPKLPEAYVTSTESVDKNGKPVSSTSLLSSVAHHVSHHTARLYVSGFVPHVALELRCGIVADVYKFMDDAPKRGYVSTAKDISSSRSRNCGIDRPQWCRPQDGALEVTPNLRKTLSQFLSERFPLSKWVNEEAVPVVHVGATEPDPLDPSRLNFNVTITTDLSSSNNGQFGDDDIVLVLLPLTVVFAAWLKQRQARHGGEDTGDEACINNADEVLNCIPESWRIFGCFPQVCYLHDAQPGQQMLRLSCYPQQTTPKNVQESLHGSALRSTRRREFQSSTEAGKSLPSVANTLPFVHALRLGFKSSSNVLYIKWIGSMNPTIATVRALFGISKTHFAPTLYDPRGISLVSQNYRQSMEQYFSEPNVTKSIEDRLLMRRLLNDSQTKAVAAALHAVHPSWCDVNPTGANVGRGEHTADAAYKISQHRGGLGVPIPEIHIIEGPPGTGKTHTISTLILNLLYYLTPGSRILLCGPSNTAVDEALLRVLRLQKLLFNDKYCGLPAKTTAFVANAELLRVGVRQGVSKDVLMHRPALFLDDKITEINAESVSERTSSPAAPFPLGRTRFGRNGSARDQIIETSPVIFTTLGSIHQLQRLNLRFDAVIVDEVSQATEPSILAALMSTKGRCILVGDWKQLQPTVLHPDSARCGLQYSLMERLLRNGYSSHLLCTQYRMHPDICAFPNRYFYEGKLQTDISVLQRQGEGCVSLYGESERNRHGPKIAEASLPWSRKTLVQKLGSIARLAFVDIPDGVMQRGRGNSWHNKREAVAVVRLMRQLRNYLGLTIEEFAEHTGIITYYVAQRDAIMQVLTAEEQRSGIQIASVDSFQGKEKDIILISCVRADINPNAFRRKQRGQTPHEGGRSPRIDALEPESPTYAYAGAFSGGLGFLRNWHRINVSLTRAKELCIVFGHRNTLEAAAQKDMQATEDSAAHCAVSISGHEKTGVMMGNPLPSKTAENVTRMDEDPFVLSKFIQHVKQHDVGPRNKIGRKSGGDGRERVFTKNSALCISSDSSVEQEVEDELPSVKNSTSTCQAVYITYDDRILFMPHLQNNNNERQGR